MKFAKPVFEHINKECQSVKLPYNITFDLQEMDFGVLVSVDGFTAGPPAVIDSPQILVPFYNPAASFIGPSLGGEYCVYLIAFLDTQPLLPVIRLKGWVSDLSRSEGKFEEVSVDIPLKARLIHQPEVAVID